MDSYSKQYPIHSLTITSTFSGRATPSMRPWMTSTAPAKPLRSTLSRATSAISALPSTA